jgi:hypothetical protein
MDVSSHHITDVIKQIIITFDLCNILAVDDFLHQLIKATAIFDIVSIKR